MEHIPTEFRDLRAEAEDRRQYNRQVRQRRLRYFRRNVLPAIGIGIGCIVALSPIWFVVWQLIVY